MNQIYYHKEERPERYFSYEYHLQPKTGPNGGLRPRHQEAQSSH